MVRENKFYEITHHIVGETHIQNMQNCSFSKIRENEYTRKKKAMLRVVAKSR